MPLTCSSTDLVERNDLERRAAASSTRSVIFASGICDSPNPIKRVDVFAHPFAMSITSCLILSSKDCLSPKRVGDSGLEYIDSTSNGSTGGKYGLLDGESARWLDWAS